MPEAGEADQLEQLVPPRPPGAHAVHEGEELDVLVDREVAVEREALAR